MYYNWIFPVLGIMAGFAFLLGLGFWILQIVAYWNLFQKAGQPGWKSLIPLYSDYTLFGIAWDKRYFWIEFLIGIGVSVMSGLLPEAREGLRIFYGAFPVFQLSLNLFRLFVFLGGAVCLIGIKVAFAVKLSRAFGHGNGFAAGIFFLPTVFCLILGLGSSRYQQ